MANQIRSIALDKLVAHPDNPNRQSRANFAKLVRNIKRTGRYEPLIVRPYIGTKGQRQRFQIINGEHRWLALSQLGYKQADAIVWDIDDEQADILLATLNRLGGSDVLDKKVALLKRLNKKIEAGELAKLLPQTAKQIERLTNLKIPSALTKIATNCFANPLVFFVNDEQQQIIEDAIAFSTEPKVKMSKAARNAAALTAIAQHFLNNSTTNSGGRD